MKRSVARRAMLRFGLRVVEERLARDLTQEELAEHIGLSRRQMNRVEAGTANISLKMVFALADALSIEVGKLFTAPAAGTIRKPGRPIKA